MKIGTIGTGRIVDQVMAALRDVDGAECIAMFTRKKENALKLAESHGVKEIYTDLRNFFNNEKMDTVYVASPNSLHVDYVLQALNNGKHVICEKPLTSTVKEAVAVYELAESKGLMVFEAISIIHMPNFYALIKEIHKLGSIKLVQCNYSQYSSRYDLLLQGETPNVFNPAFSGGALMDINIYNLHFVMKAFGIPTDVTYTANLHANGIDTSGVLVMKYDNMVVECTGAKDTRSMNFALIQGEKGYIHVVNGANGMQEVVVHLGDNETRINNQTHENRLYYEFKAFKEMMDDHNFDRCFELLSYSCEVMKVLEKARKSAGIRFAADK